MADDQDNQSLGHDKEASIQETSNQARVLVLMSKATCLQSLQPPWMARKCEAMPNATGWNLQIMHC
jgi:hypothetical protein